MSDDNLVEIGRGTIKKMGGSLYTTIPPSIRKKDNIENNDTVVFLKSSDSDDIVMRIIKEENNEI